MSRLNRILLLFITLFVFGQAYSQCNNCTNTYTTNSAIVATADNQTICITGGAFFTVISNFKNVTVKICAPNIQLINVQLGSTALNNTIESFGDNTKISSLVTEADTFSFIAHNMGASLASATINGMSRFKTTTGASMTITPNLAPGNKIFIIAEDNSTINTASITSNQGGQIIIGKSAKLIASGTVILQNEGFILNNGAITTNGDFTVQNGGNAITNFCGESTITISGKLTINSGVLYNAGIIKAATIAVNANAGPVYLNEGSQIIATVNFETNNTTNFIRADSILAGQCATFKVAAFGSWNAPLSNSSQVKYCGPTATSAQLGQAIADCNCLSEPKLCVPLCLPPTSITITAPVMNVCNGGSTVLTANAAGLKAGDTYTYSWYKTSVLPANLVVTNSNVNTLTVSTSGTYFVVISNTIKPADCSAQNATGFVFTVNPIPPQPTITSGGPRTFCAGGSVSLTAATAGFTGGTYTWSDGSTANPLVVTTSGTYTVTYKSADLCPSVVSASTTVTVNPIPPQPTITAGGPLSFCPGKFVSIRAEVNGYSGILEWFSGSTSLGSFDNMDVYDAGNYSIKFTSDAGCPSNAAVTFSISTLPSNSPVSLGDDIITCNSYVDLSTTAPLFGKGVWSVYNTPTTTFLSKADSIKVRATGLTAGHTYTFIYTVSNACGDNQTDTISIAASLPNFKISSLGIPIDTLCVGVSRRVEVTATGGSDNYRYNWIFASSTNDTVKTLTNHFDIVPTNTKTIYYVFVEDLSKAGCKTFQDTLEIDAVDKQVLMIPNLITPNGDDKNDEFRIVEKDNFHKKMFAAKSYLEVYNRWGARVFQADNYGGDWKASDATDGMYFYYLKTGCGNEEFKGWVQILANRN